MNFEFEQDLLTTATWPKALSESANYGVLVRAARLAVDLDDVETGDDDLDAELHYLFNRFSRLLPWVPDPQVGRPTYTRNVGDLRALLAMVPETFQLELKQATPVDKDGGARWRAVLHDPSLAQNRVLLHHSDAHGTAWSPNLALARLLIAGCIAALIQKTLPASSRQAA